MENMPSLLSPAGTPRHHLALQGGYHCFPSLSDLNMADLNLQLEGVDSAPPIINQDLLQGVGLDLTEHAVNPPVEDEVGESVFSDSTNNSAVSKEGPLPHNTQASPDSTSASASSHTPSSHTPSLAANGDEHHLSPDSWADGVSPEEQALMTNSANVARDRRRRCEAVQLDASPQEPDFFPPTSPASPSLPRSRHEGSDDDNDNPSPPASSAADRAMPSTPRARLQRSFMPSEREGAGTVLVPGLLRRLGRPFSGPWQGPSLPLASVASIHVSRVSSWSRLRRLFSRRR